MATLQSIILFYVSMYVFTDRASGAHKEGYLLNKRAERVC